MRRLFQYIIAGIVIVLATAIAAPQVAAQEQTTSPADGSINGHEYVDLGLPSGLLWATCNIGAISPDGNGKYFAWGETKPKAEYSEYNSLTYGKSIIELLNSGIINQHGVLTESHDAAHINWGGSWRMPTKADFEELLSNSTLTPTFSGFKITGPNGKSIFITRAGFRKDANLNGVGMCGVYWNSSVKPEVEVACDLFLDSDEICPDWSGRNRGFTIRPVSQRIMGDSNNQSAENNYQEINGHAYVDLGLPSGLKWATCNVGASSPEEPGDYFAWGETTQKPNTKDNTFTYGKSVSELQSTGYLNASEVLSPAHHAAKANWGGSWRMPTEEDFEELLDRCKWEWIPAGENSGYRVTGSNGNSIFILATGEQLESSTLYEGALGYYWCSKVETFLNDTSEACNLYFSNDNHFTSSSRRYLGLSVRPVSE